MKNAIYSLLIAAVGAFVFASCDDEYDFGNSIYDGDPGQTVAGTYNGTFTRYSLDDKGDTTWMDPQEGTVLIEDSTAAYTCHVTTTYGGNSYRSAANVVRTEHGTSVFVRGLETPIAKTGFGFIIDDEGNIKTNGTYSNTVTIVIREKPIRITAEQAIYFNFTGSK